MTNGGFCAEHGAVSDGLADSIEKCLGTHRKKLTLASVRCGAHAPLLLLVAVSIALAGCVGGGKTTTSSNQTPTISVSITQDPSSPLSVGTIATVAATVRDDAANAGVEWVAMCSSAGSCGSFSPAHTDSGAPTTFTAPKS